MLTPPPGSFTVYFFLFGRCVSAEAAAVLACGLDFELRSTLLAAEAALRLVTSLFAFLGMVRIHLLILPISIAACAQRGAYFGRRDRLVISDHQMVRWLSDACQEITNPLDISNRRPDGD